MLPDSKQGRVDYMRYREQRSFHRELRLEAAHGDMDTMIKAEMQVMAMEAELSGMREQMDFLVSQGALSPEQVEALQNTIAWSETFLRTVEAA